MNRALRTINAILEMEMIKIGRGIHEPLPKLFYELYLKIDRPHPRAVFSYLRNLPGEIFLYPKTGGKTWNAL